MIIHMCGYPLVFQKGFFWDVKLQRRLTSCPKCERKLLRNGPGQGGNRIIRAGTPEHDQEMQKMRKAQ